MKGARNESETLLFDSSKLVQRIVDVFIIHIRFILVNVFYLKQNPNLVFIGNTFYNTTSFYNRS